MNTTPVETSPSFLCSANECGRKFISQQKLNEHVRLDHVRPDEGTELIPKSVFPLKSGPLPVVYNPASADAPYGRDEQDRPLVPMRSDVEIAEPLLHDPALRGNNDPTQAPRGWSPYTADRPLEPMTADEQFAHDAEVAERKEQKALASARALFGLSAPTPPAPKAEKFVSYRVALGLTQSEILDILDKPLPFTIDKVETLNVLNDPGWLKRRIDICQRLIAHHEEKIVHWGVAWLKRNRPDNIPKAADREKYKRDSRVKIKKHKIRLGEYRKRLRDFGSDPRDQHEVKTIVKHPATLSDYDFPVRFVKRRDYKLLKGELRQPRDGCDYYTTEEVYDEDMEPGLYTIDRYRALLNLDTDAILIQQQTSQSGWAKWENVVVEKAVQFGIIPMTDTARILAPQLGIAEPDYGDETHNEEVAYIGKTGGSSVGGRIYGRGWRWRPGSRTFVPRKMDDFTMAIEHGRNLDGNKGPSGPAHDIDSGDWSPGED